MTLINANIFSHPFKAQERAQKFSEYLNQTLPDVVFLQEVTMEILANINTKKFQVITTDLHECKYETIKPFGLALFLNIESVQLIDYKFEYYPNTIQFREYLMARVKIKDKIFTLINTHLESQIMFYTERVWQMSYISKILASQSNNWILAGDMNINKDEVIEPSINFKESKYDQWSFDTTVNSTLSKAIGNNLSSIQEKFLRTYHSPDLQMITEIVKISIEDYFISDHFPLYIKCLENSQSLTSNH